MVDGPRELDAILRQLSGAVHCPGIVDEDVDPGMAQQDFRGQLADRSLRCEVGNKACDTRILARLGLDLGSRHFCAHGVAADNGNVGAECRQRLRGCETNAIGPSRDEHLLFVHWLPSRPRWTKWRTRLPSSRLPWLSAPTGEDLAAGDGYQVQATPQSPNSADVAPLLRCNRLGFQLPARQQRVPEGVIGLMHDHAFETSEEELALA